VQLASKARRMKANHRKTFLLTRTRLRCVSREQQRREIPGKLDRAL
jgi:hypothetical protein